MSEKTFFPSLKTTKLIDKGLIPFAEAWDDQESLFESITEKKLANEKLSDPIPTGNFLIFCQHPHVYTLGKSGSQDNLLINYLQLQAKNAEYYHINRGGDITYHGPGQWVAYPILNLDYFVNGIKDYIHKIEEVIIMVLQGYDIKGERLEGAIGVWLDPGKPGLTRKICAIGVRTSRWVSMHGLAFNINTDLSYFNHINPCGFTDKAVTSLAQELNREVSMEEVKSAMLIAFQKVFGMEWSE